MKNKKRLWKILLLVGIIPFIIPIIGGIDSSINGFSGLCFFNCKLEYGFSALIGSVILYSFVFWPTYIIGLILIIISIINKKKSNKKISKN